MGMQKMRDSSCATQHSGIANVETIHNHEEGQSILGEMEQETREEIKVKIPDGPLNLEIVESAQTDLMDFIEKTHEEEKKKPVMLRHFGKVKTMDEHERLDKLLLRVKKAMVDGQWRTLREIVELAGGSEAGVSARLRDLRKEGFGNHTVNRNRRGPGLGLYEYQLILNPREAEAVNRKYYYAKHPKPMNDFPGEKRA